MAAIMGDDDRTIVQGALDAAFPSRVTPVHSHGLHPDTITESTHHAVVRSPSGNLPVELRRGGRSVIRRAGFFG